MPVAIVYAFLSIFFACLIGVIWTLIVVCIVKVLAVLFRWEYRYMDSCYGERKRDETFSIQKKDSYGILHFHTKKYHEDKK